MSVKIDKYVQIVDESGLIGWIRDESNEKVIIKINMDSKEHTQQMLTMCLNALNTGEFEPTPITPSDSSNESEGVNGDIESSGDSSVVDGSSVGDGVVDSDMDGE